MDRDQQSIIDIIDSINLIFEYIKDRDWQDFEVNLKTQGAVSIVTGKQIGRAHV